jgi:GDP-4-dehydro-6-deoxy-D-mannose reductase
MSDNNQTSNAVLITGGTGFAGSHLVEHLLEIGDTNIHVTNFSDQESFVSTLLPASNIHQLDLTNAEATAELIKELQPKHVYHLAAISSVGDSFARAASIHNNNFALQVNILDAIRLHSPKSRILAVGSAQEYDVLKTHQVADDPNSNDANSDVPAKISESHQLGPANPYGVSKVDQDLLALSYHYAYQLDVVRVRPFNHIGERQTLGFAIPDFAHQIAKIEAGTQSEMKVGNLTAIRDFTDVKDIVRGYQVIMTKGITGQVYNLGSGQGVVIQDMLDTLKSLVENEVKVIADPEKFRPLDVPSIIADTTSVSQLGWQPKYKINDTLVRVLNYWRKNL